MMQTESPTIATAREQLIAHPLYGALNTAEHAQIFMKHHVFAVWDFFSLLKRLQNEVTTVTVPWTPRGLSEHARFITEIVLAEESDEDLDGGYTSHFELYLRAMEEVGADRGPIQDFLDRLRGQGAERALVHDDVPPSVRDFVGTTLSVAQQGEAHEVAASFCHGRENLLPDVLTAVQNGLGESTSSTPVFHHYLERHITLDHDEHGPLALRLLDALCAGDRDRREQADRVAVSAIEARSRLWDGILAEIQDVKARD